MTLIHKTVPFQVKYLNKDTFGRYFIVHGSLLSEHLNWLNLYGPNTDDPNYLVNLFRNLSTFAGHYEIAGELNCTLNPSMDRSTGVDQSHNMCRAVFHCFSFQEEVYEKNDLQIESKLSI